MGLRDNFKKGTVEMMLLQLLSESDMYGYQLSQTISARSGGAIEVPEGSMYPTLYRLMDSGYISDRREQVGRRQTRVYYHIEPPGRARLAEMRAEYRAFYEGLMGVLNANTTGKEADQ
jgi:PadR family transcriptional regulator PadR